MLVRREPRPDVASCLVVDPFPTLLGWLGRFLEDNELSVVGMASDIGEAAEMTAAERPDVVVLDPAVSENRGLELIEAARGLSPDTRFVVFGSRGALLVDEVLGAGACGVALKDAAPEELLDAIDIALRGGCFVHPSLFSARRTSPQALTDRERDVLTMLMDGHGYEAIADRLGISTETVRAHVAKARRRLGAHNKTEAVALALRVSAIE